MTFNNDAQTEADVKRWDRSIEQYNAIVLSNTTSRVAKMTAADVFRYAKLHNMQGIDRNGIVKHLAELNSCNNSTDASDSLRYQSGLMARLVESKPTLKFAPPQSFGKPWYELFDEVGNSSFQCFVEVFGPGRRLRDAGLNIWLLRINDCLWECGNGSEEGVALILLEQIWTCATGEERVALWTKAKPLLESNISFAIDYGEWKSQFNLELVPTDANEDHHLLLESAAVPKSNSLFGLPRYEVGFPLSWVLTRSLQ